MIRCEKFKEEEGGKATLTFCERSLKCNVGFAVAAVELGRPIVVRYLGSARRLELRLVGLRRGEVDLDGAEEGDGADRGVLVDQDLVGGAFGAVVVERDPEDKGGDEDEHAPDEHENGGGVVLGTPVVLVAGDGRALDAGVGDQQPD